MEFDAHGLKCLCKAGEALFSSIMYVGLSPLLIRFSCRSLNNQMNFFSLFAFVVWKRIMLLPYSYNTNRYLLPLFGVTWDLPVSSVAIFLLWSIILVNIALVCCAIRGIGGSYCILGSFEMVDWGFFPF